MCKIELSRGCARADVPCELSCSSGQQCSCRCSCWAEGGGRDGAEQPCELDDSERNKGGEDRGLPAAHLVLLLLSAMDEAEAGPPLLLSAREDPENGEATARDRPRGRGRGVETAGGEPERAAPRWHARAGGRPAAVREEEGLQINPAPADWPCRRRRNHPAPARLPPPLLQSSFRLRLRAPAATRADPPTTMAAAATTRRRAASTASSGSPAPPRLRAGRGHGGGEREGAWEEVEMSGARGERMRGG